MNARAVVPLIVRILLGLIFFVFGLNGFLNFIPQPPLSGRAGDFVGALAATGYIFPLVKGIEVIAGGLLLANRYVALALVLLAPIVVNIFFFHTVLAPPSPIAFFVVAALIYLAYVHREAYRTLFRARL